MTDNTDPPPNDDDSTRSIVLRLQRESREAVGAARVWRWAGALATTVALAMGGTALTLAQQAAVDHEIVARHEREIDGVRTDLDQIQAQLAALIAITERVERRLDRREETP